MKPKVNRQPLESGERRRLEARIEALESILVDREVDPDRDLNAKFKRLEEKSPKA